MELLDFSHATWLETRLQAVASVIISLILKTTEDLSTQELPYKGTIVAHFSAVIAHSKKLCARIEFTWLTAIMKPNCLKSQLSGVNVESWPWQLLLLSSIAWCPK